MICNCERTTKTIGKIKILWMKSKAYIFVEVFSVKLSKQSCQAPLSFFMRNFAALRKYKAVFTQRESIRYTQRQWFRSVRCRNANSRHNFLYALRLYFFLRNARNSDLKKHKLLVNPWLSWNKIQFFIWLKTSI